MAELREQMASAIRDQMTALARLRGKPDAEVLSYLTQTYRENAGLSVGTGMESYWLLMVDVATHEVVPR